MRLDYRTRATEGRGKTHKKRLISCVIRFRETERRFHDEKHHSAKNQTQRMTSPGEVSEWPLFPLLGQRKPNTCSAGGGPFLSTCVIFLQWSPPTWLIVVIISQWDERVAQGINAASHNTVATVIWASRTPRLFYAAVRVFGCWRLRGGGAIKPQADICTPQLDTEVRG